MFQWLLICTTMVYAISRRPCDHFIPRDAQTFSWVVFLHQASKGPEINSGRGAGRDLDDSSFLHYQIIGWRPAKPYAFCPGYRELMQRDQWAGSGTWERISRWLPIGLNMQRTLKTKMETQHGWKKNIHRTAADSGEFYNAVDRDFRCWTVVWLWTF